MQNKLIENWVLCTELYIGWQKCQHYIGCDKQHATEWRNNSVYNKKPLLCWYDRLCYPEGSTLGLPQTAESHKPPFQMTSVQRNNSLEYRAVKACAMSNVCTSSHFFAYTCKAGGYFFAFIMYSKHSFGRAVVTVLFMSLWQQH